MANSVIAFISLASVCNYTKAYDWRRDRTVMLVTVSALGAGPLKGETPAGETGARKRKGVSRDVGAI